MVLLCYVLVGGGPLPEHCSPGTSGRENVLLLELFFIFWRSVKELAFMKRVRENSKILLAFYVFFVYFHQLGEQHEFEPVAAETRQNYNR